MTNLATRALTPAERRDWLKLARTDGIGPVTFHRLIARFSTAREAVNALPHISRKASRAKPLTPPGDDVLDRELAALDKLGARLIAFVEPDFPRRLRQITPIPPLIAALGPTSLDPPLSVAMVGARAASALGRRFAQTLAGELGEAGVTIVSGLARGIDGAAHHASLDTGSIAVVAGGLDVVYPPEHRDLHRQLVERGAIVSERALGLNPTHRDFPRRNRLISGLADAVVVVEASRKSGSLITARYAGEQGRDVLAAPGHPLDPRAEGVNHLLKNGAGLVESAEDVLEAIRWARLRGGGVDEPPAPHFVPLPEDGDEAVIAIVDDHGYARPEHARLERDLFAAIGDPPPPGEAAIPPDGALRAHVLSLLSPSPTHRDEIVRASGLETGVVASIITELTLTGDVVELDAGYLSLRC